MSILIGGLTLFSACSQSDSGRLTRVKAHQITDTADLIGGKIPSGGLGDWYLANDRVEAIFDDIGNPNLLAASGGSLIDFAVLGKDNDQFNSMYQIFMFTQDLPIFYTSIKAKAKGDTATITMTGYVFVAQTDATITKAEGDKLKVTTEYKLLYGDPKLYVKTTMVNTGDTAILSAGLGTPISDVIPWATRSVVPYAPYLNRGWDNPALDVRNPIAAFGTYRFIGAHSDVKPFVAYGFVAPKLNLGLAGVNSTAASALGMAPNLNSITGPLDPGESQTLERILLISSENTIESIAAQALPLLKKAGRIDGVGTLSGTLTGIPPGRIVRITAYHDAPRNLGEVYDNATRVVNESNSVAAGEYHFTLVAGEGYKLRIELASFEVIEIGPFKVTDGHHTDAGTTALPVMGTVTYEVTADDGKGGVAKSIRLTFKGTGSTLDPVLGPPHSGAASRNLIYSLTGKGSLEIEPGTYDLYISRGMEYTLARQQMTVVAGQAVAVAATLKRVLITTGLLSVDAHVHSGRSYDASLEDDPRILGMAGEGVEVVISTEHDYITNYETSITALGLAAEISSITGVEVTANVPTPEIPHSIGHHNGWPVHHDPTLPRAGAPKDEHVQLGELVDRMHDIGAEVIQLNHGRSSTRGTIGLGFFDNYGFDPTIAVPSTDDGTQNSFLRTESVRGTSNFDFDMMEILNGPVDIIHGMQNRDDWFSLLRQGFFKVGAANSDSHQPIEIAGFPRNYVSYAADTPVALDTRALDNAMLAGKVIGTTGPLIEFRSGAVELGETAVAQNGKIAFQLKVSAVPWIPVQEVRVYVNGVVVCVMAADGTVVKTGPNAASNLCPARSQAEPTDPYGEANVTRYDASIELVASTDMFVTVEAGDPLPIAADTDSDGVLDTWDSNGDGSVTDEEYGAVPAHSPSVPARYLVPDIFHWAFTNPIFVDSNGDGYTALGL